MTKPERGTKRTDPETGRKFYDLNKDPIVSPFTGKTYPLSFFEQLVAAKQPAPERARKVDDEDEAEDEEVEDANAPEVVSLDEAEAEETADEVPETDDVEVEVEEDLGDDDEDVFLEEEDDDDDDLAFDVNTSDEER